MRLHDKEREQNMKKEVIVIGAGLAGSEAAYQLSKRNIKVHLYEMRGTKSTEAHQTNLFAELVCSNSLRSNSLLNAVGLLKEEMRMLDSLIIRAAELAKVEAGDALAVDRFIFSTYITKTLEENENIEIHREEITQIPEGNVIIATGPLTSKALSNTIGELIHHEHLYFFDAVAPIITSESINMEKAYLKSRYDKGEAAYINCPMTKEEFFTFYHAVLSADRVQPKDFEMKVFEGCMPFEEMAARGEKTLLFGPLKPVGLRNPHTGEEPYAVVQLRQDDALKTSYNLVGFQTRLTWPEQKKVIRLIPGLENAEIIRYGVMHKNTYIQSPQVLNHFYQYKTRENLFFAGQVCGVEGYVESASSGLMAGIQMAKFLQGKPLVDFSFETVIGSLAYYISTPNSNFIPMNANYGLLKELEGRFKKLVRKELYAKRSIEKMKQVLEELDE